MKKIFLLLFTLCTALLTAQENQIFTGVKGGYAIYEDSRYGDPFYISVCYVGEDSIVMRSYEPVTGDDFAAKVKFNLIDGIIDYDPDMLILKGELDTSEAAKRLLLTILNWANTWYNIKGNIGTETQFNGEGGYHFSFWIPVFQLSSIGKDRELKLITSGVAGNERDPAFMEFTGLPKASYSPSYSIRKGKPLTAEIDGISIPLDENWNKDGDSLYSISKFSDKDALFTIETVRPAASQINSTALFVTLSMLATDNQRLLANGSRVFITDGVFNLVKRTYDEKSGRVYIHQMQFLPRGNGYISVARLSVLETLYQKNKSYFNAILY